MKIALAQFDVIPNRPDLNVERMIALINKAKQQAADVICFSEMCVMGYLVGDRWTDDDFCREAMYWNAILRLHSYGGNGFDPIGLVFGNIYLDERRLNGLRPAQDGRRRRYNAIYAYYNGEPVPRFEGDSTLREEILPAGVDIKTLLPTYRFFDDDRYFTSKMDIATDYGTPIHWLCKPFEFKIRDKRMLLGLEACEDLWCKDYRYNEESLNPTKFLIQNGAEAILNLSASPWTFGKQHKRDREIAWLKSDCGKFAPFMYVNCVGVQNNGKNIITFDGGTTVYGSDGLPRLFGKSDYQPDLLMVEPRKVDAMPVVERPQADKIAQKYLTISRGLRHVAGMTQNGDDSLEAIKDCSWDIALSGGVDSAVVTAILVATFGEKNVRAYNLPTEFNSKKTQDAARRIAKSLGIAYRVISINAISQQNRLLLEDGDSRELPRVTDFCYENVMAKIRGTTIMSNIAAKNRSLFTCNGNKVEIALGYFTLDGDGRGAVAPIGDLTKTEVYAMARFLNKVVFSAEVIPAVLLPNDLHQFEADQILPSAELQHKQIDPMKFGYHCALVEAFTDYMRKTPEMILQWYLDGTMEANLGIDTGMIWRWGINRPEDFLSDLEWFTRLTYRSVFKHVQTPPIIVTSKSAFGYDYRESILPFRKSNKWLELEERVKKMHGYQPKQ